MRFASGAQRHVGDNNAGSGKRMSASKTMNAPWMPVVNLRDPMITRSKNSGECCSRLSFHSNIAEQRFTYVTELSRPVY